MDKNKISDSNKNIEISISNLHAHASIISRLGEELISDEITAFSELIKNSYDADSPKVNFEIDCLYNSVEEIEFQKKDGSKFVRRYNTVGKISLEDEGTGMNLQDIERGWLTISNSIKKEMKKNNVKTIRGRVPLGEKGLGRLSLQRLGNFSTLITKKEGSNIEYKVHIPWILYEEDLTLEDVRIKIEPKIVVDELKGYTKIIIKDLKNKELWYDSKKLSNFEKSLMQITSPFGRNYKFKINGIINGKKIDSELISKSLLEKRRSFYDVRLEKGKLIITGEFGIEMFARGGNFPSPKDIKDYFESKYFKGYNNFQITEEKNRVQVNIIYDNIEVIDGIYQIDKYYPGDFKAKIYDFNLDNEYFKAFIYNSKISILGDVTSYRNLVKTYHGIYIIRDGFTILPYGFDGKDWLGMSAAQSTSMGSYALKNDTIIGYIELDGENNSNLKEKTDREGFINNVYYSNFVTILTKSMGEISGKLITLIRGFNKYKDNKETKKFGDSPKTTTEAVNNVDKAINSLKSDIIDTTKNLDNQIDFFQEHENKNKEKAVVSERDKYFKLIESSASYLKRALDEQNERIEVLANLAGLGLISEAISHDMMNVLANFEIYTNSVNEKLNKKHEININDFISYINSLSQALRKQISHIAPGFTVVRDKREIIDIRDYFQNFFEFYLERASKKNIKLNLKAEDTFNITINRGQLNQVFDNLFLNSEYWLMKYMKDRELEKTEFNIEVFRNGIIQVWDSGYGISENREEDLFYPFVTDKSDGRGLGLYIVQSILSNNNAQIELLQEKNSFNRRYIFEIRFNV